MKVKAYSVGKEVEATQEEILKDIATATYDLEFSENCLTSKTEALCFEIVECAESYRIVFGIADFEIPFEEMIKTLLKFSNWKYEDRKFIQSVLDIEIIIYLDPLSNPPVFTK